jgi:hypothetical protein
MLGKLSPQERVRLAQRARKLWISGRKLSLQQKANLRRHAFNLMKINLAEAKRNLENPTPKSARNDRKLLVLPENSNPLNRAALRWLKEAKDYAEPNVLHLLNLAYWGLENGVEGDWPERDRYAIEMQIGYLLVWKPQDVLDWLTSHPDGPDDREEQKQNLLNSLQHAKSPRRAAALVLSEIYSRQQAALTR